MARRGPRRRDGALRQGARRRRARRARRRKRSRSATSSPPPSPSRLRARASTTRARGRGLQPQEGDEQGGSEAASAIDAVAAVLSAPFLRPSATLRVRVGAMVRLLGEMPTPTLERHSAFMVEQLLTMLNAQGGGRRPTECVTHVLRAGLGETLGALAARWRRRSPPPRRGASEPVMIGALKETAQLLLALRGVATEARDALMSGERPLPRWSARRRAAAPPRRARRCGRSPSRSRRSSRRCSARRPTRC